MLWLLNQRNLRLCNLITFILHFVKVLNTFFLFEVLDWFLFTTVISPSLIIALTSSRFISLLSAVCTVFLLLTLFGNKSSSLFISLILSLSFNVSSSRTLITYLCVLILLMLGKSRHMIVLKPKWFLLLPFFLSSFQKVLRSLENCLPRLTQD